jgi:hypothetical protein
LVRAVAPSRANKRLIAQFASEIPVTQALLWFEELVSSDAFVLMCLMFVSIGLLELAFPARKIPWRHYWFNLTYAFVNIVAISVVTPFISAATAYGIQTIGLGLIDLRSIGLDGTSGRFLRCWSER